MCGARWSASRVNLPCSLYTASFDEHASSLSRAAATGLLFWDVGLRTSRHMNMLSMSCATTRQWSAFFFSFSFFFVRSFQLELFQRHERRVVRCACIALALWTPCFSCAVVSRRTHLPLDPSCRNQDPHIRSYVVVCKMGGASFSLLVRVG